MSKKLNGNGIWESHRFMIPEHVEGLNAQLKGFSRKKKPEVMDEELEIFFQNINISMCHMELITIVIFGEYEDREVSGIVTQINTYKRKLKIMFEDDGYEWIDFDEIVKVVI